MELEFRDRGGEKGVVLTRLLAALVAMVVAPHGGERFGSDYQV